MATRTFTVSGMTCQHCVNAVTSEVTAVAGVSDVHVDLDAGTVTVTGEPIDDEAIRGAIDEAGYAVTG